jgi:hypothetical protein
MLAKTNYVLLNTTPAEKQATGISAVNIKHAWQELNRFVRKSPLLLVTILF